MNPNPSVDRLKKYRKAINMYPDQVDMIAKHQGVYPSPPSICEFLKNPTKYEKYVFKYTGALKNSKKIMKMLQMVVPQGVDFNEYVKESLPLNAGLIDRAGEIRPEEQTTVDLADSELILTVGITPVYRNRQELTDQMTYFLSRTAGQRNKGFVFPYQRIRTKLGQEFTPQQFYDKWELLQDEKTDTIGFGKVSSSPSGDTDPRFKYYNPQQILSKLSNGGTKMGRNDLSATAQQQLTDIFELRFPDMIRELEDARSR